LPRPGSQPAGAAGRVAGQQLYRVTPHEDPQVIPGLGQQASGIGQPEAVPALQGVQLVHVAVHQYRPLVAVRLFAQASAWSTAFSVQGRPSCSHDVTMKSASHRAWPAPVGSAQSGAGRQMRATVAQRIPRPGSYR
jgi:hypothetical protein